MVLPMPVPASARTTSGSPALLRGAKASAAVAAKAFCPGRASASAPASSASPRLRFLCAHGQRAGGGPGRLVLPFGQFVPHIETAPGGRLAFSAQYILQRMKDARSPGPAALGHAKGRAGGERPVGQPRIGENTQHMRRRLMQPHGLRFRRLGRRQAERAEKPVRRRQAGLSREGEGKKLHQIEHMRPGFADILCPRDPSCGEAAMDEQHRFPFNQGERRLCRKFLDFAIRRHGYGTAGVAARKRHQCGYIRQFHRFGRRVGRHASSYHAPMTDAAARGIRRRGWDRTGQAPARLR